MQNADQEQAEESSFGTLQMSNRQVDQLKRAVDQYIDRFDDKSRESPPSFTEPAQSDIRSWLAPPPLLSQVDNDRGLEHLLATIESATATGIETTAGSMLSYIPGNELRSASLARYIAAVQNRFTGAAFGCPGGVALEQSIINWMTALFELGPSAGGVLLSGGSIANFTAVVTARNRFGDDFHDGIVYVSASAHHSALKACRLAGIPQRNVRIIPLDAHYRMDTNALEEQLKVMATTGQRPMLIIATAGTTDMGVIDPLDDCAILAQDFGAWFHVDAAYGGFFNLTKRGRARLCGIHQADSITVDAHKGLFTPFGLGALLVADRQYLLDAHSSSGAYMRDAENIELLPDFSALGPELTRPYRGLELWLPLHLHGVSAFQKELDRMLDMTARAEQLLREISFIDVIAAPDLSVVCFRSTESNSSTQRLLDVINRSGIAHVSSTTIAEQLIIRLVFLNFRTTEARLLELIDVVRTNVDQSTDEIEPLSECA